MRREGGREVRREVRREGGRELDFMLLLFAGTIFAGKIQDQKKKNFLSQTGFFFHLPNVLFERNYALKELPSKSQNCNNKKIQLNHKRF